MTAALRRRDLVAAAGLSMLAPAVSAQGLPQRRPWPAGRKAPELALPDDAGRTWRLVEARGRVVLLNFWASWCEPCRAELPSLELLAARLEARGLLVMAVNHRETDAALRRFTAAQPLTLPILRDADGGAARAFEARIFPTTVLIDRQGRVRFSVVGEADWSAEPARGWVDALVAVA